jgi:hypothetical protein
MGQAGMSRIIKKNSESFFGDIYLVQALMELKAAK